MKKLIVGWFASSLAFAGLSAFAAEGGMAKAEMQKAGTAKDKMKKGKKERKEKKMEKSYK